MGETENEGNPFEFKQGKDGQKMKRTMKVSIATLLLLAYSVVLMQSFAYSAITEEEIDAFLAEQGVPKIAIQKLPFDLKKRIYLGESTIEVGEPAYGVFTDDYRVEYKLENGQVVMDEQSRAQLQKLLSDEEAVANVLLSNEQAEAGQPVKLAANVKTEQDAVEARKAEVGTYRTANREQIQSFKAMPEEAVLRTMRNWESYAFCIHLSYSNAISEKILMYSWMWSYSPLNTLVDKAAMAWSGDFVAEPDTFGWVYQGYRLGSDEVYYEDGGSNCTDYEPKVGIGTEIDIKAYHAGYSFVKHAGLLAVALTKRTTDNSYEAAVGRYFHKVVAISPSGTLSFSSGKASASISISWSTSYDKAPDTPCTFWAITK